MTEFDKSRRSFISGHFSELGRQPTSTDKAIERVGEGIALAAVVGLAYTGSHDRLLTHTVHSESNLKDIPEFDKSLRGLEGLSGIFNDVHQSVETLAANWKSAYEKSRVEYTQQLPKEECSGYGDSKVCRWVAQPPKREIVYYWEEPYILGQIGINHSSIASWSSFLRGNRDNISHLFNEAPGSFDMSQQGGKLFFREHQADTKGQSWLAFPLYAAVGSGFVLYEEILKKMEEKGIIYESPVPEERFLKRRTLLKLGAVLPLAYKIREAQLLFAQNNKGKLGEVKAYVDQVLNDLNAPADTHFQQFFGIDVISMRNTIQSLYDSTSYAQQIFHDQQNPAVNTSLEQTAIELKKSLDAFDNFFSFDPDTNTYTIPDDLTNISKSILATQRIIGYTQAQSERIYTRHFLNASAMAFGLTTAAIVGEAVFSLTDKKGS